MHPKWGFYLQRTLAASGWLCFAASIAFIVFRKVWETAFGVREILFFVFLFPAAIFLALWMAVDTTINPLGKRWRKITGRPISEFPAHKEDCARLFAWAIHDILQPLAQKALSSFCQRDIARGTHKIFENNLQNNLPEVIKRQAISPADLRKQNKESAKIIKEYRDKLAQLEKDKHELETKADEAIKTFDNALEFFAEIRIIKSGTKSGNLKDRIRRVLINDRHIIVKKTPDGQFEFLVDLTKSSEPDEARERMGR